jgi:hypothetical protein
MNDDQIIVTGLFHCARNPHLVESKLRDRKK